MKIQPLVSVLIPLYNHESYVKQCLDSVLSDTYSNKEIIIIDDASNDDSATIVQRWIENYESEIKIRFCSHKVNGGICATLNELIDMSSGQYLAILASDDYLLPGGIQTRLSFLQEHSEKMAVIGDCIVVDRNSKQIFASGLFDLNKAKHKKYFSDSGLKSEILYNFAIPGPVLMVNRDFYNEIGKYDEDLLFEDFQFYLKAIALNKIGFIGSKVSAYRWHQNNSCRNSSLLIKRILGICFVILDNYSLFQGADRLRLLFVFATHSIRAVRCTISAASKEVKCKDK